MNDDSLIKKGIIMKNNTATKYIYLTIGALLLLTSLMIAFVITKIPAGHVGVPVKFGRVLDFQYEEGLHLKSPFNFIVKMDLRTKKADEEGVIPSKEMLNLHLKTSINYHLDKRHANNVYSNIGPDYFDVYIEPHFRSAIREITSDYNAEQFFSTGRNEIQGKILALLLKNLSGRGIIVESVMLKEILPPESVRIAIESRQSQQQQAEAMKFRLQRERLEADRKKIEAKGIQEFQEIVKKGIDSNLLAWKGIEATQELAKSPNSKIVLIGTKEGLPLISVK